MKELDNRLEDLLHKHTFNQLTESDKDYVLSNMSAHEYNHLHKIVQVSKNGYSNEDLNLPPSIKSGLKKNLKNKWHHPKTISTMLMPLLWIGIGAFLMHFLWNPNDHSAQETPIQLVPQSVDTVYVQVRDTIIREVQSPPIVQIKEVIRYKEVRVNDLDKNTPIEAMTIPPKPVTTSSLELSSK